jgi:hypothetical protein
MNKRVITTSLALVLAMTMVLAVGKTTKPGQADPDNIAVSVDTRIAPPRVNMDIELELLAPNVDGSVLIDQVVAIRVDVDEDEILLAPIGGSEDEPVDGSVRALMDSLARVQSALVTLEQVAARTESAVAGLTEKRARQ